jgi:hypothetical protein
MNHTAKQKISNGFLPNEFSEYVGHRANAAYAQC